MQQHPYRALLAGLLLVVGGASLAGGCGATINVVECDGGEERCGDSCVDLDTDPKHCGECFARCVDGCTDGVCDGGGEGGSGAGGDDCAPLSECAGECVDYQSDRDHCGACNVVCSPGEACQGATCVPDACAPLTECDGLCVDLVSDPFHCGRCDNFCSSGLCSGGLCVDSCPAGFADCSGACVDLSTNEQHCGDCFFACGPNQQCENFNCFGNTCDLECGLCGITELGSTTFVTIGGTTGGVGDGFTSSCAGGSGAPEVGHRFVAPFSGTYVVDTFGSSFDTVLSVLSGCGEVTCSDDEQGTAQSQVIIDLFAGQEVFFVVDGYGAGVLGQYTLTVRTDDIPVCPPDLVLCGDQCVDIFFDHENCGGCFIPCGDEESCQGGVCQCVGPDCGECDTPTCNSCSSTNFLPSSVPITRNGSTTGEDDGIEMGCGTPSAPEELFFFQAPFAASYRFDTAGSSYDTVLGVRSPGSCSELACDDDAGGDLSSFVEVPLAAGQNVIVVVDGFGEAGDFQLHVDADIPLCAPVLEGPLPIVIEDSTVGQPDLVPISCIGGGNPERIYHFIAPSTRSYTFRTTDSDYDPALEILNGTCGGPSLGCNDDFDSLESRVDVFLERDQMVTVVVDAFAGEGDFTLRIE